MRPLRGAFVAADARNMHPSARIQEVREYTHIPSYHHGKIFAKFQQVENIYTKRESSTGLGLTITKEFVEMHGGRIWLESKIGEGTTFIFEVPLKQ